MDWRHAAVIADAAACGAVSWDSESWAGEMLQPAGYRPAGAWVRAGAGLRGAGGSVGMSCVRFALVLRFWRGVLCSSCACHTFLLECLLRLIYACRAALSECLMFDHAYCLPHGAKQDGLREAAFLFHRGSRSPVVRSRIGDAVIGRGGFTSGLRVSLWRSRRRTKGRGNGERSRRRGVGAFLRDRIGFVMFSAGSTLGQKVEAALRPRPRLRQGDKSPWTLFI